MSITCIVSDIDGTLLPAGEFVLSPVVKSAITNALDQGKYFVAASGRPYRNLYQLMGENRDRCGYICQNGTLGMVGRHLLFEESIPKSIGQKILDDVTRLEECEVLVNCREHCYFQPKEEPFRHYIQDQLQYPALFWSDLKEIPEDYLQISIYRKDGIEKSSNSIIERWKDSVQAVVSGKYWMDLTAKDVCKGSALRHFQKHYGLTEKEILVLGDSYNDVSMLTAVPNGYAMQWAKEDIKNTVGKTTDDPVGLIRSV